MAAALLSVDILRVAALIVGGFDVGLAVYVIRLYLHANRVAHDAGRAIPGALPYHVYMIASSHLILIGAAMTHIILHFGEPLSWLVTPVALLAFTLTAAALIDMLRYQRLRVHRLLTLIETERKEHHT